MNRPALSLILCSRNDQYMGNSRWRLETTLNYVAQRVYELAREEDVEILVADWGSEIPLREVLELNPAAIKIVSFVLIPPEIARALQKDSPFPEVLALNAVARRARGEYIGRIDQDTLVGKHFLEYFFDLYEGNLQMLSPMETTLLFANRRSIPYQFVVRCPRLCLVDMFIRFFGKTLKVWVQNPFFQNVFWASYVGIWLIHRNLWDESSGYDERLIYYNWMETDMILRLSGSHPILDLGKMISYDFYHLEHYNPKENGFVRAHKKKNPNMTPSESELQIKPNGENWGLIQFPFDVLPAGSEETLERKIAVEKLGCNLPAFFALIVTTAIETVSDTIFIYFQKIILNWIPRIHFLWSIIKKEPMYKWPKLITRLWLERKSVKNGIK